MHGDGVLYINGQKWYEGGFVNGVREGFGKEYDLRSGDLEFEGVFKNGNSDGLGVCYQDGSRCEGNWKGLFCNG